MRPLTWSSANAVFLPEIDAEHRTLFRMANELQTAVLSRAPKVRIEEIVQAMTAHLEDHFSHEERLMRSTGYGAYPWHKGQHDGVRRRVKKAAKGLETGDRGGLVELCEHLAGWLRDHTSLTDRMMGAHLRNHERLQAIAS